MDRNLNRSRPFDINALADGRPIAVFLALALACAQQAGAQTLDSTVGDLLDDQIDQQVEDELTQGVEDTIQEEVEQQIESGVTDTIERQIESGVVETIEQQVESGVTDTIQEQVESGVEQQVEEAIEGAVDLGLGTALGEIDDLGDAVEGVADGAAETAGDSDGDTESRSSEAAPFVAAIDALGRTIEREVWVILVPSEHVARIEDWGFTVRERRDLGALDRVLLRVDAPENGDIAEAALELALDAPGTLVDFNHVYESSADPAAATASLPARAAAPARASSKDARPQAALGIGLIDSAIATDHVALTGTAIEQKDFVPFENSRPTSHGTAVASILAGQKAPLQAHAAKIWAASVFFRNEANEDTATTASLVAALDWLADAAARVRVINMSLTGPANVVLEAALDTVAAQGLLVVAAVGNNGPVGEALYPAAYDTVVGVTAVDSANRIYHYANRGRQVMFAAPGVEIEVASDLGGYGMESGTSMAAPYATALLARSLAQDPRPAAEVLTIFQSKAIDLGDESYDEVFGFGLIAPVE